MNDASEPKSLFANYKMNQFFGGDVIHHKKTRRTRKKSKKDRESDESLNNEQDLPLNRKIFHERNMGDFSTSTSAGTGEANGSKEGESLINLVKMK